jgi:hypothetical protein
MFLYRCQRCRCRRRRRRRRRYSSLLSLVYFQHYDNGSGE